jgi:hypothetical protein
MKSILRVIVLLVVLFGILGLARNQVAWAADPWNATDETTVAQTGDSISPGKDDDCDDPKNKDRARCKEKEKDKCKKNPKQCGSVKPPPRRILIPVTGEYSVGGFCTLTTVLNDPSIQLDASIITPLPKDLPDPVQNVRQGCLLEYSSSNQHLDDLPPNAGSTIICFAAPPGKQLTIYFYDRYSTTPEWFALETTADVGKACAPANGSGVYVATFSKP